MEMIPADKYAIDAFKECATDRGVPSDVIGQIVELYELTDGVPCIDGFDLHSCGDEIIFEFWNDKELWIAQNSMDMLRWANGKFCLGHAGDLSYGEEYEFDSLAELLEAAFSDWY